MTMLMAATLAGAARAQEGPVEIPLPPIETGLEALPGPDKLPAIEGLPDPLIASDGKAVATPGAWTARRKEMKKILTWYAVGKTPPAPANVTGETVRSETYLDGKVQYDLIHLSFGPDSQEGFDAAIFRPAGAEAPVPVFIHLSFDPAPGSTPLATMPRHPDQGHGLDSLKLSLGVPEMKPGAKLPESPDPADVADIYRHVFERGYAMMIFNYQDAGEDTIARNTDGSWAYRNTRFVKDHPDCDWGLLGCWAWAVSRCADYLETQDWADKSKLGAVGHSRLGKAVLAAGAFDERIALSVPAGSAGGGAGAYRFCGIGDRAETLDIMTTKYPNWFSPRLRDFRGKNDRLPFDQHWFAALTAPRGFLALESIDDHICSPYAVRKSIEGARPAYDLLGEPQNLGVWYTQHGHALTATDWNVIVDFADRVLKGKTSERDFGTFPARAWPENKPLELNVRELGAIGNGKNKERDTAAFQEALDRCGANPAGGVVLVPTGNYLVGSLDIKSNTTLQLTRGSAILGSPDAKDYPIEKIRWEGRWRDGHVALLRARSAKNIKILGPGKIAGCKSLGRLRNPRAPALIETIECDGVRIQGLETSYERMWSIHPTLCDNVVVKKMKIRSTGGNGDGVDVDSCREVRIEKCDIETGDDCVAIKSGRGMEGFTLARPSENIVVRDCAMGDSIFACMAIGSEMSGGVHNVLIENCTFRFSRSTSIYVKSRPGRGGEIVNVTGRNLTVESAGRGFLRLNLLGSGKHDEEPVQGLDGVPQARDFRFSHIRVNDCPRLVEAWSVPEEKPLDGFVLSDVTGSCKKGLTLANMKNVTLEGIKVEGVEGPLIEMSNVEGTGLEGAVKWKGKED